MNGGVSAVGAAPRRVVMTTFGSLGDLHPYLALGRRLRERGHQVVIATQDSYRGKVEGAGLDFHRVRPDVAEVGDEGEVMERVMDPARGPEFVIREVVMKYLRDTYADLTAAVADADLFLTHPITMAAQLVAEKQQPRLAWASAVLAPSGFYSATDAPVFGPTLWTRRLRPLGTLFFRPFFRLIKQSLTPWVRPWHDFRRELGLPPTGRHPLFDGQFSPEVTLALYSPVLGSPQPDWPPGAHLTGFAWYDSRDNTPGANRLDPALSTFLDAGEPPIVFTLGSSAVMAAGDFYAHSLRAARRLGRRAVLLTGRDPRNKPAGPLSNEIGVFEYAPYSDLFPRAAAVVHQCGIGTCGQALRAGRPMLLVPFGFDQPDNADRLRRLGVGRVLPRNEYSASRAARELAYLLERTRYAVRAAAIAERVRGEDGAAEACRVIEAFLASRTAL